MSTTKKLTHLLLAVSLFGVSSSAWANPLWSIEKLLTTTSYQDGPNCYNAALAGSGLINYIGYTDSTEFRFFLETQCKRQAQAAPGTLIAISQDSWLQHGLIAIGENEVFEKDSFVGKSGQWMADKPSTDNSVEDYKYVIRPESKSPYIQKCTLIAQCDIEYFSCPAGPNQAAQACSQSELFSEIRSLRLKLQTLTLTPSDKAERFAKDDSETLRLLKAMNSKSQSISPKGLCAVHFLVSSYSIVGSLFFSAEFSQEEGTLFFEVRRLRKNLDLLRGQIMKANSDDSRIQKILKEQFQNTAI